MTSALRVVDIVLVIGSLAMAVASVALRDADKAPVYLLLAYALWRLGHRPHS